MIWLGEEIADGRTTTDAIEEDLLTTCVISSVGRNDEGLASGINNAQPAS